MQSKNHGDNMDSESLNDIKRDKTNNFGSSSYNNLENIETKKKDTANRRKSGVKEKDLVDIDENTVIKGNLTHVRYYEPKSNVLLDEEIISMMFF